MSKKPEFTHEKLLDLANGDDYEMLSFYADAWREEVKALRAEIAWRTSESATEVQKLKAEIERLRGDAERYRRLRQESVWIEGDLTESGAIIVRSLDKLDARVDQLMGEESNDV